MSSSSRISFSIRLLLTLSLLGLVCPRLAEGQISFYQPLSGYGGNFVADFNGDGIPDMMSTGGGLLLGNGDGTFRDGTTVPGGAVAVGDFNGDGKVDVLQLGTGGPLNGILLVLLGNGDGTFQAPITTYAYVLQYVIAGDLNGDGRADVVGFESTANNTTLVVYLSQGDGTFAAGVPYTVSNAPLGSDLTTLGDFNGDHITDIAISLQGQEVVLLGNGDGTFQTVKTSTGVSFSYGEFAFSGDFNGDGRLDIVLAGELLLGNGDGTFQAPTPVANGVAQAVGDFNGDGKLDLAVSTGATEICLGNGDGTFSNGASYIESLAENGVPDGPFVVADFNVDGKLDIIGGGYVLLGNGDGTFQGLLTQSVTAVFAEAGSFDKKGNGATGLAEIASTGASLYVLANDGAGNLTLANTYAMPQPSGAIASADLNGDGFPDLIVPGTTSGDWGYSVLPGNGDNSFQSPQFYPQGIVGADNVPYSMVVADFNNDHKLDVAIGPVGTQSLAVLLGNGDGTFASPAYVYDGGGNTNATYLIAADFNGDGNVDIATSPLGTGNPGTALLFGNGDGTFQPAIFPLGNFTAYGSADFNQDSKPDLWGYSPLGCQVLLGNGDGTFTAQTPFSPVCFLPIVVADINGDGILDIFADYYHPSHYLIPGYNAYWAYLGNGDGTFQPPIQVFVTTSVGSLPMFELLVDMNGDGKPDLVSNAGTGYTYVLLNTTISAPVVTLSPTKVTFPPQPVGTSSAKTIVKLTNSGAVALVVASVTMSGANASEFSQTNNCIKIQPNQTCAINVTFSPTVVGTANASVLVADNAGNGSQTIALSGTAPELSAGEISLAPAPGSPTSAEVSPGQNAVFELVITPAASFTATVNLACRVSPAGTGAPTCSVPASVQVSGGNSTNASVTVKTRASGSGSMIARGNFSAGATPIAWTMVLFASAFLLIGIRNRRPALATPALMLAFISWAGCGGGGSGSSGTPANTYSVTVTASSGNSNSNTTLTVIVQ
jgi:hypothetical protein